MRAGPAVTGCAAVCGALGTRTGSGLPYGPGRVSTRGGGRSPGRAKKRETGRWGRSPAAPKIRPTPPRCWHGSGGWVGAAEARGREWLRASWVRAVVIVWSALGEEPGRALPALLLLTSSAGGRGLLPRFLPGLRGEQPGNGGRVPTAAAL